MKAWFFGSGTFAALCFREIALHVSFERVVTLPPTEAGRGRTLRPTPLEDQARLMGFDPYHSSKPSSDPVLVKDLDINPPDLALVIDFSRLIKAPLLDGPRFGCFNIHPSLLPAYRGAAPLQRALMDGRTETGVTLFQLVQTMDAGPIVAQKAIPVGLDVTAGKLMEDLATEGSQIFLKSLKCICGGYAEYIAQDDAQATYAPKLDKAEERLSWSEPAWALHNRVRALNPAPGSYCFHSRKRIKIWKTNLENDASPVSGRVIRFDAGFPVISCGEESLRLLEVQPEGKKTLSGAEWARGARVMEGDLLE